MSLVQSMSGDGYGGFAEFYDRLVCGFDYAAVTEYYDEIIRENGINGGILLDLACGTGNLSVRLADCGWDVIGVDISPEMLSFAKTHDNVSYICQDMTELDLYGTVDAAVCCFDALNHLLEEKELQRAFERVALFMNEGGVFVFDMNTIYCHEKILGDNTFLSDTFQKNDNVFCAWQYYLGEEHMLTIFLNIFAEREDGSYCRREELNRERAYSLNTIGELCEQSGFKIVGMYDFLTKNRADENNKRVVFVCVKI